MLQSLLRATVRADRYPYRLDQAKVGVQRQVPRKETGKKNDLPALAMASSVGRCRLSHLFPTSVIAMF